MLYFSSVDAKIRKILKKYVAFVEFSVKKAYNICKEVIKVCANLGKKIKELRKSLGLSQLEFSKVIGISRSYLGDIETGRKKKVDFSIIDKISSISGKPTSYFLSEKEEKIKIIQYEILDSAIELLISKGLIAKDGKVNEQYKDMVWSILEKEIAMKIERRTK